MNPASFLRVPLLRKLVLLVLLLGSAGAAADAGLGRGLKADVRLLIDISGSMKDSDPDNLRAPALDLIVRLLPEGSKAGVWIFGHDVELLVEHRVIDKAWREEAARAVAEIDNSGQLTDIPAVLEAAMYDFNRLDPGFRTSVILLTDGKVDVSKSPMTNAIAARDLLAIDAPKLGAAGIPVHTVALSNEADWTFLNSLAKATGGIAEQARSAEKLTKIYYQALEMVAPTSRIPLAGQTFEIDPSVHEFTALIFLADKISRVGLVGPTGKRYKPTVDRAGVEWFRNRKFALVTVAAPEPGRWTLEAPGAEQTRISVISDLKLEVDPLPNSLPAGKPAELGLRLRERGAVLTDPEVLGLFSLSIEIENARGEVQNVDVLSSYPIPEDGEFRVAIPGLDIPGRYKVTARLQGETLQRELPMYVKVIATPGNGAISTRGRSLPETDMETPLISFAVLLVVLAVVVSWILRRRKRRKLEVWKRRNLEQGGNGRGTGQFAALSGVRAAPEERDSHS